MHSADAQFLYGLEGTEITTDNKTDDDQSPVEPLLQKRKITQKLSETAFFLTQNDVDEGHGFPFTASKYLSATVKKTQQRWRLCESISRFLSSARGC